MSTTLTLARAREALSYDAETGDLTWRISPGNGTRAGMPAGTAREGDHRYVTVDRMRFPAHRLAWFVTHGRWPVGEIDHKNGVRTDNRLTNLRDVTRSVNRENLRGPKCNSKTGLLGAFPYRDGRFTSQIRVRGRSVFLGHFKTASQAHAAYIAAKRLLHEGNTL